MFGSIGFGSAMVTGTTTRRDLGCSLIKMKICYPLLYFSLSLSLSLSVSHEPIPISGVVQDEKYWPLMPPLPSYGYGRECPGPRYGSLIHGQNLKDVVITGALLCRSCGQKTFRFPT
ncbi:hypothetical protein CsSME_00007297 [Camellia sinensis var. sinensis]